MNKNLQFNLLLQATAHEESNKLCKFLLNQNNSIEISIWWNLLKIIWQTNENLIFYRRFELKSNNKEQLNLMSRLVSINSRENILKL